MVKIRLRRDGAKKAPFYTLVVADSRYPMDGRFIEKVGTYNPMTNPKEISVDLEKVKEWISKGARPTETAKSLIAKAEKKAKVEVKEVKAKKEVKEEVKEVKAKKEVKEEVKEVKTKTVAKAKKVSKEV